MNNLAVISKILSLKFIFRPNTLDFLFRPAGEIQTVLSNSYFDIAARCSAAISIFVISIIAFMTRWALAAS